MSRWQITRRSRLRSFPRVSGDEPAIGIGKAVSAVFSPRERG